MIILRRRVAGLSEATLARFVKRACAILGIEGDVDVLVTGNRELRDLNGRFRKKNIATDVLSFPPMPGLRQEFAGEVAISAEIANRNARRLGHSAAQEIKILTLHGILHLAGFDHDHDAGRMARKENHLRTMFSLPHGLIERSAEFAKLKPKPTVRLRPAKVRRALRGDRSGPRSGARATPTR